MKSTNLYAYVCTCAHSGSILWNNKLPAELKFGPVNGPQTGRPTWRRLIRKSAQTPHNHAQPLVLISHCFAPFGFSPYSNTCCHSNILCGCTDIPAVPNVVVARMFNKFRSITNNICFYQTAKLSNCTTAFWIRIAGHVARVVIGDTCKELLLENMKERYCLEDLDVDGSMIFKWILKKSGWDRLGYIHVFQDTGLLGLTNWSASNGEEK